MEHTLPGDLWPDILDVEKEVAAAVRCHVHIPAHRGDVCVDPPNNDYEEQAIPAESFDARLLERAANGDYYVTRENHRPWVAMVKPEHITLDLDHREVVAHLLWKLADYRLLDVGPGVPLLRRFERGHIHGWELVGLEETIEWSNVRAEGMAVCDLHDARSVLVTILRQGF